MSTLDDEKEVLELAVLFHVIYERKSVEFNYVTRTETRIFDPESPNGKLMIATCKEILQDYAPRSALAERDNTIAEAGRIIEVAERSEDGHCPLCGAILEHTKDCPIGKYLSAHPTQESEEK